ncbi:hypothetical protein CYMTET_12267 [Cymbomonas tetramitiformis]|uniref:Uncharacterized protein n=1 Tax=Cymbomonas tetramitiformis TaxID=36881 RepID=A0AAE0GKW6_9CHLO|nr:hypothetical protein CYMTET_12267 [Cymbomonas tetramitiformis]
MAAAITNSLCSPCKVPNKHRAPRVLSSRPCALQQHKPRSALSTFYSRRSQVVRAIQVSGPGETSPESGSAGQVTAPLIKSMQTKIQEALEAESVEVCDVNGDQQHVSIDVVSTMFEGKNRVQRQRMVYKAIWEELQETVHAVDAMTTKTPEELNRRNYTLKVHTTQQTAES